MFVTVKLFCYYPIFWHLQCYYVTPVHLLLLRKYIPTFRYGYIHWNTLHTGYQPCHSTEQWSKVCLVDSILFSLFNNALAWIQKKQSGSMSRYKGGGTLEYTGDQYEFGACPNPNCKQFNKPFRSPQSASRHFGQPLKKECARIHVFMELAKESRETKKTKETARNQKRIMPDETQFGGAPPIFPQIHFCCLTSSVHTDKQPSAGSVHTSHTGHYHWHGITNGHLKYNNVVK